MNKQWYKSKTIWAAFASLCIAVLTAMYGSTDVSVALAIALASAFGVYGRASASEGLTLN